MFTQDFIATDHETCRASIPVGAAALQKAGLIPGAKTRRSLMVTGKDSPAILIIDDEAGLLDILCAVLEGQGFRCIPANKPAEAVDVCESDVEIDLVLSDLNMPMMNGVALWNVLRLVRPTLDVIFMSGNAEACEELADRGLSCLQKPFSFAQLTFEIRRILAAAEGKCRA
jgi:DNA-binding NtrC family response regulator